MTSLKPKDTVCEAAILGFTFNDDFTEAAFSPNNHLLHVVSCRDKRDCTKWEIVATLEQHDQSVSAIAWHGKTNRILSCAQDRTAFVWQRNASGKWNPQMVLLDAGVKRGLTSCAWSPSGAKIYVGSAAANIAVGRFDEEDQWWICRLLTGHESTVTALAPHPSDDTLLASGGTDGKLMLVSTYMKKQDGKDRKVEAFGHVYYQKDFAAWVHSIAWAPSGKRLAVATHDSRVHVLDADERTGSLTQPPQTLCTVNLSILPLKSLCFVEESHLIGGGFDYYPVLFTPDDDKNKGWRLASKWTAGRAKSAKTQQQLARERFQNEARIGQAETVDDEQTRHKNTINGVLSILRDGVGIGREDPIFVTASLDGRVEAWTMAEATPVC